MELPKHTTQVGTIAAGKKLYLEDYCISYMRQQGEAYPEERKQIALFGTVEREKNIEYAFAYGAAMLGKGKGRTDSLTNSQKEEAERFRMDFFPDYQLLGIVISTDAVNENVYWLGNGNKAVPMEGYYIFYDSNEAMLNFMMQNQKEERTIDMDPVIAKKADMDRERREKAEKAHEESAKRSSTGGRQKGKSAVPMAASVMLLAAIGVYGVRSNALDMTQISSYVTEALNQAVAVTGRYLGEQESASQMQTAEEVLMTEEMLVAEEVQTTEEAAQTQETEPVQSSQEAENEVQPPAQMEVVVIPDPETLESVVSPSEVLESAVSPSDTAEEETGSQEYLIKQGDNLLRILRSYYGDESKLAEICDINNIVDPDNIQVGQKILLP